MTTPTRTVWAGQVRKGDVIVIDGQDYRIASVAPMFGGSMIDFCIEGHESEPVAFGHAEKIQVRS